MKLSSRDGEIQREKECTWDLAFLDSHDLHFLSKEFSHLPGLRKVNGEKMLTLESHACKRWMMAIPAARRFVLNRFWNSSAPSVWLLKDWWRCLTPARWRFSPGGEMLAGSCKRLVWMRLVFSWVLPLVLGLDAWVFSLHLQAFKILWMAWSY